MKKQLKDGRERAMCDEGCPVVPERISADARMAEIAARYPKAAADARKARAVNNAVSNEEVWNA